MSPAAGKMLSWISACFVLIILPVCFTTVQGQLHRSLKEEEVLTKINEVQFFVALFCDDPEDDDCSEYLEEVAPIVNQKGSRFAGIEGAVITAGEVSQRYGIEVFPALLFFRKSDPVLYAGPMITYNDISLWMEQNRHTQVLTLTDSTFEHDTQATTGATTGDWLILFYENRCVESLGRLETVAAWLKQQKVVAKIELTSNPITKARFGFDDCATIVMLSQGKMYKYQGKLKHYEAIIGFGKSEFKEEEAMEIPPEPSAGFAVLEFLMGNSLLGRILVAGGGTVMVLMVIAVTLKKRRKRRAKFD